MNFRIEYELLAERGIRVEYVEADDAKSAESKLLFKHPYAAILKVTPNIPSPDDNLVSSIQKTVDDLYKAFREYEFHFGDDVGEPSRSLAYAQGYMSCFIQYRIPKERQHIFFRIVEETDEVVFRKLVQRFTEEDWKKGE